MSDDKEMTCAPNYAAMYDDLFEEHKKLCAEYADIRKEIQSEREKRLILEAQMEVVRLIFGGDGK